MSASSWQALPQDYDNFVHVSETVPIQRSPSGNIPGVTPVFACKPTALHDHAMIAVNAILNSDTIRKASPTRREIRFPQMKDRRRARALAAEFIQKGDPTGWFEALYREAEEGKSTVPWADYRVSPYLASFWTAHPQQTAGKSALVVGSGPGDDAEQLAAWGFRTTAFDISETAIRASRKRFPHFTVDYHTANLLDPPAQWRGHFDFVFEANTLQVLPASLRPPAAKNIASFLRPGGLLLVVARGREPSDPEGQMPWPLTRAEISAFVAHGLEELSFEVMPDLDEPDVRRFRALFHLP